MKQFPIFLLLLVLNSVIFAVKSKPIDVVIPCHEKDSPLLDFVIDGIRENGKNVRRIIVVSKKKLTEKAEWFDEAQYPFNRRSLLMEIFDHDLDQVLKYETAPRNRTGWIYQQFLKLYAPFVISDISSNVLILDADTIFLNPVEFFDKEGNAFYTVSCEYHRPYFDYAQKLFPGFKKVFSCFSGISHHMLLQKPILEKFMNTIRTLHQCEPWIAMCRCLKGANLFESPLSEYELYFNFIFMHEKKVKLRELKYLNFDVHRNCERITNEHLYHYKKQGCHYISCHNYAFEIS